jgi:hypothetical protein
MAYKNGIGAGFYRSTSGLPGARGGAVMGRPVMGLLYLYLTSGLPVSYHSNSAPYSSVIWGTDHRSSSTAFLKLWFSGSALVVLLDGTLVQKKT